VAEALEYVGSNFGITVAEALEYVG